MWRCLLLVISAPVLSRWRSCAAAFLSLFFHLSCAAYCGCNSEQFYAIALLIRWLHQGQFAIGWILLVGWLKLRDVCWAEFYGAIRGSQRFYLALFHTQLPKKIQLGRLSMRKKLPASVKLLTFNHTTCSFYIKRQGENVKYNKYKLKKFVIRIAFKSDWTYFSSSINLDLVFIFFFTIISTYDATTSPKCTVQNLRPLIQHNKS